MKFLGPFLSIMVMSGSMCLQTPVTNAQASVMSPLSSLEVSIGDDGDAYFQSVTPDTYETNGYTQEDFEIRYGTATIYVTFINGDVSPTQWHNDSIDAFAESYDTFEVMHEQIGETQSSAVFRVRYLLNYRALTFTQYETNVVNGISVDMTIHSGEDQFLASLEWAQEDITVGGQNFEEPKDLSQLEEAISGSGRTEIGYMSTVEDWSDEGLVSETEGNAPDADVTLTWQIDKLEFNFGYPYAILYYPGSLESSISFLTPDRRGEVIVNVWPNNDDFTARDWEFFILSDEFLEGFSLQGYDAEPIDSSSSESSASVILNLTNAYEMPVKCL